MKKFEYEVIKVGSVLNTPNANIEKVKNISNRYGKMGWELASTNMNWLTSTYTVFFRREQK
jgi:hypothetical protein